MNKVLEGILDWSKGKTLRTGSTELHYHNFITKNLKIFEPEILVN